MLSVKSGQLSQKLHLLGLMKGNYSFFTAITADATHLVLWVGQGAGQEHSSLKDLEHQKTH